MLAAKFLYTQLWCRQADQDVRLQSSELRFTFSVDILYWKWYLSFLDIPATRNIDADNRTACFGDQRQHCVKRCSNGRREREPEDSVENDVRARELIFQGRNSFFGC